LLDDFVVVVQQACFRTLSDDAIGNLVVAGKACRQSATSWSDAIGHWVERDSRSIDTLVRRRNELALGKECVFRLFRG
jgi:hypothetical protein